MTGTKDKLLDAAERSFLLKGYAATSVDEICAAAGATKGAFFHHFKNKREIALVAVDRHAEARFAAFRRAVDPARAAPDRVLDYIDQMIRLVGTADRPACLVAGLTIELSDVEPEVHARVDAAFRTWTKDLIGLLEAAGAQPAEALAHQIMATFQGSLIVARARRRPEIIAHAMRGVRDHVANVLGVEATAA